MEIVRLCLAVRKIEQKKRKLVIFSFFFNLNNFLLKKGKRIGKALIQSSNEIRIFCFIISMPHILRNQREV